MPKSEMKLKGEYILVTRSGLKGLEAAVNELILLGYRPQGGPFATMVKQARASTIHYEITQAMVLDRRPRPQTDTPGLSNDDVREMIKQL